MEGCGAAMAVVEMPTPDRAMSPTAAVTIAPLLARCRLNLSESPIAPVLLIRLEIQQGVGVNVGTAGYVEDDVALQETYFCVNGPRTTRLAREVRNAADCPTNDTRTHAAPVDRRSSTSPAQPGRLARVFPRRRILVRTAGGSSFCSDGQSVSSATLSMVLKVVTERGRCVWDSVLLAPVASSTSASSRPPRRVEQRAEGGAVGQQRTEGGVLLLLLVRGQRGVGLGDIGEELRVLRIRGLRCPQWRRRARRHGRADGRTGRLPQCRRRRAPNEHQREHNGQEDAAQGHGHGRHVASVTHASRR